MKKIILTCSVCFFATQLIAQTEPTPEITKKNSWFKAGAIAGIPVGNTADVSSFVLGLDLKGQLMSTNHIGIGITTGYNHFFAKDGFDDFGTIPLGAFIRVYPASTGFFGGLDLGYSFLTQTNNNEGGFYIRPQIGYHNYDWNFFGYYNHVFRNDNVGGNIQHIGVGATYNLRFN